MSKKVLVKNSRMALIFCLLTIIKFNHLGLRTNNIEAGKLASKAGRACNQRRRVRAGIVDSGQITCRRYQPIMLMHGAFIS